ncbi:DUF4873 domain-containing protein [Nocardiopsis sp. N85]|uniref:DUF4873 domain-containing protein n=1 Tax=Nocardiopsis sp. N85 TaxID=3029400 RepID=UPI00237FAD80|nr:DUF4873 domain-containing protein [Nocardiopsis sp. N85]MDE3719816.1 DUF4873 domain-containing protein [Nocardiopsis sp. N85]
MSGFDDDEEEYRGEVTLTPLDGEGRPSAEPIGARCHVAGHFSPLTGDYRWSGRLSPSPEVTAAYESGVRAVLVRTPDGHEGTGTLAEANLWGGHPINGSGTPPYPVPRIDLSDLLD